MTADFTLCGEYSLEGDLCRVHYSYAVYGDENLLRFAHDAGSAFLATPRQREQPWAPMRYLTNVLSLTQSPSSAGARIVAWRPTRAKGKLNTRTANS